MGRVLALIIILAVTVSGVFAADESEATPSDVQSQLMSLGFRVFKDPVEAPDFTLTQLGGDEVSLSSFRGKVVFLNFWATWCPPCRAEMPSMQVLYEALGNDHFEIIAVDLQESERTVQKFIDELSLTFPILLDSKGQIGAIYGARSIPTTFLIDKVGNAIGFLVGSRTWEGDEVEALFNDLID
jgi:thiol-disulfide isomerase/thioredoxin